MFAETQKRIFLVGCSRSGTSLVQSLVACHPLIHSFPETHFFNGLHHKTKRKHLIRRGLSTGREVSTVDRWLRGIGRDDIADSLPRQSIRFRSSVRVFSEALDVISEEGGATMWLEKTPMHILFTDLIERYVEEVRFIHLVRDGRETVASIYDRALKHHDRFEYQQDIGRCVSLWNQCVRVTAASLDRSNTFVCLYEDAVDDPLGFLNRVGEWLGVDYRKEHLKNRGRESSAYVLPSETWKAGLSQPIQAQPSKFERLFSEEQKEYIVRRLDMRAYNTVVNHVRKSAPHLS